MDKKQLKRNSRGNMLILSSVFITVNALGILIASSFSGVFFEFNRLQSTADELALAGARKLNEMDRIGQMNNMIARSRQVVFDAYQSREKCSVSAAHLTAIADELYQEAREGSELLEQERMKLDTVSRTEATQAITNRFDEISPHMTIVLPWLKVGIPAKPTIVFGHITNMRSNVEALKGMSDLENHDKTNYIDGDSKLYKDEINATLPAPNADLKFKLSSLPAPVNNIVAPARAVLAKAFAPETAGHITSAVQVEIKLDVDTMIGASAHSDMQSTGTALATGGEKIQ